MRVYCVGGAVRDELLGLPVQDRDWVVVGASPELMISRGYVPVGKDFPVFLHPQTGEQYALARTERKVGLGYKGFTFRYAPDVTLEDDLRRRDLTINAIARDDDGTLIDPHGGRADLQARVLRHVGESFVEDPVRILRLARFAARFTGFTIAPETEALMRAMTAAGEVDALVPERIWQEMSRGLMESRPSRMFEVLRNAGALARLLPELDRLWGVPQRPEYHPEIDTGVHVMMALDYSATHGHSLPVRFAVLTHDLGKGTTPPDEWPRHVAHEARSVAMIEDVCNRLRVPNDCRDLARIVAREHGNVHRALQLRPGTLVSLLERIDVLRRPRRLDDVIAACEADLRGRLGLEAQEMPQADRLRRVFAAMQTVDAAEVAARFKDQPEVIRDRLHAARASAVQAALGE